MNVPKLRFKEFDGEWEEVMLCKVSDVRDGTHDSPKYVSVGYPLITSKNLNKDGTLNFENVNYINEEDFHKINQRSRVDNNDILFGMIGTIGNPVKVKKPEFAIKNVALIKEKNMSNDYLIHYLKSTNIAKQFYSENKGGTQKFIALNNIRNLKINKPKDIFEVKQIAAFFDALTKKIQLQQQKIDLLQEQKKGYMQKIFSREIRFDGFKEPWEEKKLEDISKKITKGTTPKDKSWEGTVKYVKTDSIDQISGEILNKYFTSIEEHEGYLNRSQLKKGDILFSIVGTLGRVGIVKEKNLPANTNQQIAIIRLKEKVDKNFIFNVLKSSRIIAFIKSDSTVGAQPSLSLWQINELQVPYPNQEEQKKIGTFFKKIDDNIILQQQKSELLQKQKQGFMQQMFI